MTSQSQVDTLYIHFGRFNQCVVGLTIPLIYWMHVSMFKLTTKSYSEAKRKQ